MSVKVSCPGCGWLEEDGHHDLCRVLDRLRTSYDRLRIAYEAGRRDALVLDEQAIERATLALVNWIREDREDLPPLADLDALDSFDARRFRADVRVVVAALRNEQEDE